MDLDLTATVSIVAVTITLVNLVKYVRAGLTGHGWNGAVSLALTFLILLGVLWLYGNSVFGEGQIIGGKLLADLDWSDLLVVALAFTGPASVTFDIIKAVDNTNSARTPQLVPPKQPAVPPTSHAG